MFNVKKVSMKKLAFLLPIAALALASCSNEVVEQPNVQTTADTNGALVIRPIIQGATRGTVATDANLASFHAVATPTSGGFCTDAEGKNPVQGSIDADVVKQSASKWVFNDNNTYYWQSKSTEATFSAYAPKDINQSGYTVKNTVADQEDIIVAYNEGAAADFTAGVPMNFQHVLSQIIIQAKNKDAATFKVEVAGVKLYNVANVGNLTLPTVKTASPFDWTTYPTVWTNVSSTENNTYTTGATTATATPVATLTTVAADITSGEGPMLLMPQQLTAATSEGLADNTNTGSKTVTGTYLAVLIRATDISTTVPELDKDGKYLKSDGSGTIDFDAHQETGATGDFDTYTASKLDASAGTYDGTAIKMINEVKFPREGYGNNSTQFAYVCVPIDTEWKPGYKYTYTLNFSKDGIGKIDPNFATGHTGADYPGGTGGLKPGEDVIDNPIELFFTVTIDSWSDATEQNVDM